jgi:hypothetical protein
VIPREDIAIATLAALLASETSPSETWPTEAEAFLRAFADEIEALQLVPRLTTLDDLALGVALAAPGFFSCSGLSMLARKN